MSKIKELLYQKETALDNLWNELLDNIYQLGGDEASISDISWFNGVRGSIDATTMWFEDQSGLSHYLDDKYLVLLKEKYLG